MFGKHRNHVVDNNGKVVNGKNTVDHYLKPNKKKMKPVWIILIVLLISALTYAGVYAYNTYKKIVKTNKGSAAPFLSFLDNVSPDKLNGEGDGRINILLLGNGGTDHPGGTLTDTIQVLSIDPNNKKIAMLSLPRDLYVEVPNYGGMKINEVYYTGDENTELAGSGAQLMKNTVSEVLDLPIHYYIKLDFEGFKQIVDELGGVDVNVAEAISDPYYPAEDMVAYDPFYVSAGEQHFDGETALKYARSRETTSDFSRSARQQQIMTALRSEALSAGVLANPSQLTNIIKILGEHVSTDIQLSEMERLAELLKEVDTSSITSKVIDNSEEGPLTSSTINGGYYLTTKTGDYTEVQRIAHELFTDPYLQKENAKLEVLNGTSQAGLGTDLSNTLKSYGYNVINVDKSDKQYQQTTIYDYSNGKYPYTVKFLTDRYNATAAKPTTTSKTGADIEIIVGNDYITATNE